MIFVLKVFPIYVLLCVIKDFVMTVFIKPKIGTTQNRFLKNLSKSVLWSDPYKMPIAVLLIRKT